MTQIDFYQISEPTLPKFGLTNKNIIKNALVFYKTPIKIQNSLGSAWGEISYRMHPKKKQFPTDWTNF